MKKDQIFCFIILNYITTKDTIECVNSIKKYCKNYNYNIIIVDNASPNKSGEELLKLYNDDKNIKIFINSDNIGFAKGNNVGFEFAKREYNPDFIIMCNSDTEILNRDFCDNLIDKYKKTGYAVLGPKEKLADGGYYPLNEKIRTKRMLKLNIKYYNSMLNNERKSKYLKFLMKALDKIEKRKKLDVNKEYTDIVLHGAFLAFSKDYISRFNGLNPITYFYGEEEFLALRLFKNNLHSIYYPNIQILHKKSSSTNASSQSKEQKKMFTTKCHLDSSEKLLAALNGEIEV